MDCSPARLLCPWDSPGKNTGVLPCPLPDTGMEPRSPALQADSLPGKPKVLCKWAQTLIHTHTHTHTHTLSHSTHTAARLSTYTQEREGVLVFLCDIPQDGTYCDRLELPGDEGSLLDARHFLRLGGGGACHL